MRVECRQDKALFIAKIQEIGQSTRLQVAERAPFETAIAEIWKLTRDEERDLWRKYIAFELERGNVKRAKLIYERALITMDKDRSFWLSYINFIDKTLKDPQMVRAKFENRIKLIQVSDKNETLELMLEQALFEEE